MDTGLALFKFKSQSQFQSLVIQYLIGLKAQSSELEELKRIFLELDVDQDGQISEEEMLQGMESVTKDL